jgi:virginiamycin A acetyltransferase
MTGPDKKKLYSNDNIKTVCFISNLPKRLNFEIGHYTYYYSDNKKSPEKFYDDIEHHYEFMEGTQQNLLRSVLVMKR